MESRLRTTTGRVPACSLPSVGSRRALNTSPRTGFGRMGFGALMFIGGSTFGKLQSLPVAPLKFAGQGLRFCLIFGVRRHLAECSVDFGLGEPLDLFFDGLNYELVET